MTQRHKAFAPIVPAVIGVLHGPENRKDAFVVPHEKFLRKDNITAHGIVAHARSGRFDNLVIGDHIIDRFTALHFGLGDFGSRTICTDNQLGLQADFFASCLVALNQVFDAVTAFKP